MIDEEFDEHYQRILDGRKGMFFLLYPDAPEYKTAIRVTNEAAFEKEWRTRVAGDTNPDAEFFIVEQ